MDERPKREMTVSGRLPESVYEILEHWRINALLGRKRAEVIGLLLERILGMIAEGQALDQPLEHIVRRLRLEPV